MIISAKNLKENHPDIWNLLSISLGRSSDFPCLFAMASFKKEFMQFVIADSKKDIAKLIASSLLEFSEKFNNSRSFFEKTYETLVLICKDNFENYFDEGEFIGNLLNELHSLDPSEWPIGKTKNTNDQEFEFYWNNVVWFPVLLHKNHNEKIRRSPFLIIGFQPGETFEFNKKHRALFYERMRNSIHARINKTYENKMPFHMSEVSTGKNICQYAGLDKTEIDSNYQYPVLINR